jgi:hypothetical protein
MQIVELGDCSMVIMKDCLDSPWFSIGDKYRSMLQWKNFPMQVRGIEGEINRPCTNWVKSSDCIYTAGRLILYFNNVDLNTIFKLHDRVELRF